MKRLIIRIIKNSINQFDKWIMMIITITVEYRFKKIIITVIIIDEADQLANSEAIQAVTSIIMIIMIMLG